MDEMILERDLLRGVVLKLKFDDLLNSFLASKKLDFSKDENFWTEKLVMDFSQKQISFNKERTSRLTYQRITLPMQWQDKRQRPPPEPNGDREDCLLVCEKDGKPILLGVGESHEQYNMREKRDGCWGDAGLSWVHNYYTIKHCGYTPKFDYWILLKSDEETPDGKIFIDGLSYIKWKKEEELDYSGNNYSSILVLDDKYDDVQVLTLSQDRWGGAYSGVTIPSWVNSFGKEISFTNWFPYNPPSF